MGSLARTVAVDALQVHQRQNFAGGVKRWRPDRIDGDDDGQDGPIFPLGGVINTKSNLDYRWGGFCSIRSAFTDKFFFVGLSAVKEEKIKPRNQEYWVVPKQQNTQFRFRRTAKNDTAVQK